jgi:RND family efflux transporter MFP subunit
LNFGVRHRTSSSIREDAELQVLGLPILGLPFLGLGLLFGVCIPLLACGEAEPAIPVPEAVSSKPVEVEVVELQHITSWVHVSGLVEAESRMSLSFRVDGTIERFLVEEGDFVEAESVIAELDSRDYERELRLARADVESSAALKAEAQRELTRQERLIAAKTTSSQQHEAARSSLLVATAATRQSELRLEAAQSARADCELRAPVSGYIEQRLVEKHEFTTLQRPAVILTQLNRVKVQTSVADRMLASLKPGSRAIIRSAAWPDREIEGTVVRIALAADPTTHTLPVEISVANPDLALRPAMVVDVALRGGADGEQRLTVPMKAVVRDGGLQPLCFVVGETQIAKRTDGEATHRVEARPVVLGKLWRDRIEITAGLTAGSRVITAGQHFVRSGDAVHIVATAAPPARPETEP